MANTENKKPASARKPASAKKPTGVKKSTGAKKPTGAKRSASAKKPASKRVAKNGVVVESAKPIPEGLRNTSSTANKNLDHSIVKNKGKKKKRKKGGNAEKVFWIVVFISVVAVGVFGALYVFEDYGNDNSTPMQLNTPQISEENLEIVKNIGADNEVIESISVSDQGPLIYVIYTVPAGTNVEEIMGSIGTAYKSSREANVEMFDTYSFQITIVASGDEAEGVNDYPVMGAMNYGKSKVTWMTLDGTYKDPTAE